MWVEVAEEGEGGKFFVAVIYVAPPVIPKVKEINEELFDELNQDIIFFREQGKICILGDFNCRIGELESRISREGGDEGEERKGREEEEIIYKRRSEDKIMNKGGRNLVDFMNAHNLIIVNGIDSLAPMTSLQVRGQTVIDYIICDQNLYEQVKNFRTWEGEFSMISDHRLLTLCVKGRLETRKGSTSERKQKEKKESKRGWRRAIKEEDKFERICEEEMGRWCKEQKEIEKQDCEQMWHVWLERHNKIAEEAIGRIKVKKKREWEKGEGDQKIFEYV